MFRIVAVVAALAVAGLVGGVWYVSQRPDSCGTTAVAGGAGAIGGPFTLVNSDNETVTSADVITGPSLLYFGYTFCPDVCPLDLHRNAEAVDILADRGIDVTPIFISIDPARDTPDVVGDYVANISDRMIGLTGSPEQVKAASRAYRTFYQKQPGDEDYYIVNHSTFSYLVLPGDKFIDFFRNDDTPEQMADKIACYSKSF